MPGAAQHAAHTDKMSLSMTSLATAHCVSAEASNRAVEAVKEVGFGTEDAIHAFDRLIVADMNLSKAEGLAKVPVRGGTSPRVEPSRVPLRNAGPCGCYVVSTLRSVKSAQVRSTQLREFSSSIPTIGFRVEWPTLRGCIPLGISFDAVADRA
jgi:hypothetical protein